ncbi:hypothetical protein KC19_4G248400 [Ceratodon purpureus]|uniref:FAD-binding domain-containing protein n=1 Tax=Ceratodon purpureus TaxID=3225 RepID=A0A8T0ICD2_CERPU|nr:hypothetical protein KC19_4G248400 [Ceratodon purpureus]
MGPQLPRIAIIGGGPAGLVCARVLQMHGLRASVYEADEATNTRPQGGSLDLHAESGLLALTAAGLIQQFREKARPEGQQVRILDKDGHVLFDLKPQAEAGDVSERPEIDRSELRSILLDSLDPGTVHWNRKLVSVADGGDHGAPHTLIFQDGVTEDADLVIGADGAWSKVRPLVTPATPAYSGFTMVDLTIRNADERYPKLGELVGDGLCFMLAQDRGLLPQRNSGGLIHVYATVRVEEGWAKEDFAAAVRSGGGSVRELLLRYFEGWNPELLEFIRNCDDAFYAWRIYSLPIGHRWSPKSGFTLLGDAAHLLMPFAGEGVNVAMLDGMKLAMALVEAWSTTPSVDSLRHAIPAFEEAMFERAEPPHRQAARNVKLMFDDESPHTFVNMFKGLLESHPHE